MYILGVILLFFNFFSELACFCLQIAGIFSENVRVVIADCNKNYAVAPEAVSEALSIDLSSGLIPFFICATVSNLPCFFSYANFLDLEMLRIYKLVWT